jgi:hypothetical protein
VSRSPIIEPKVGVVMLAIATVAYVALGALVSCGALKTEATYAEGFERCYVDSGTCEEYLRCWQDNQRAHQRPVTGSCRGGSDAGADR